MGDLLMLNEYTQKLLDTLERLNLYKPDPIHNILRAAAITSAVSFGTPDELLMSPEALKAFKKYHEEQGK